MRNLIFMLAGWLTTYILLPGMIQMIRKAGFVRANYRGETIPYALGVVLYVSVLAVLTITLPLLPEPLHETIMVFLFTLTGFTLLGLMDDFWGSSDCKGLAGHMKSLFRGEITTGTLKAGAGGFIALSAATMTDPLVLIPLNALIIALSVNLINLLDLRPGRAGKAYLLGAFLMLSAFPDQGETIFLMVVAGSMIAYLPFDLKAKAMMGDSGSNALGSVLGLSAVWLLSLETKVFYVVLLVMLHWFAEKYSLTRIISNNKVLNYLDQLGRK